MVTLDEVMVTLKKIIAEIAYLPERIRIAGNQIVVTSLSEISETLGLVKAGEFRSGNNKEPGTGFSGLRIMYPPFQHDDKGWNLAGFEDDVLKVGISASDGSLYGIGGRWWLNDREMGMLHTEEIRAPQISWRISDGSLAANIMGIEVPPENYLIFDALGTSTSGFTRSRIILRARGVVPNERTELHVDSTGRMSFTNPQANFIVEAPGRMSFVSPLKEMRWEQEGVYQDGFRLAVIPAEGALSTSTTDPFPPSTSNVDMVHMFRFGRGSVGVWQDTQWRPLRFRGGVYDTTRLQVENLLNCSFTSGSPVVGFPTDDVLFFSVGQEWFGSEFFPVGTRIIAVDYANRTVTMNANSSQTNPSGAGSWRVPANTYLDVFAKMYIGNASVESCLWNGETRVDPLAFRDGILVRSSNHGHTYLGTIKTTIAGHTDTAFIYNQTFPYKNLSTYIPNVPAAGGGATTLDGLTDVIISSPSSAQVLRFNGSNWVNGTDNTGGWTDDGTVVRLTTDTDRVGIGKLNPGGPLAIMDLPIFASHAAAVAGGLTGGDMFRTGTDHSTIASVMGGINWTIRTSAADNEWHSVTFGNNLFVAVAGSGVGNRVMTSPDGITWTTRTSAADNDWNSIVFGNNLFVAVSITGVGNRVMTSPDGINWTIRTSAADNSWQSVTFGNNLFVAVAGTGSGNRVMTSPDGITWTTRTSAADNLWRAVTFGNNLFVAVATTGTGNRVMTSPDGINWTIRTSAADNSWQSVTFGNNLFVAVSLSGTGNRVMTSPDGITWTSRTSAADNNWRSVIFVNSLFVTVASTGTNNRVMTSPNGITWTTRTSAADIEWRGVTHVNGRVVAVASTGTNNRVMTS